MSDDPKHGAATSGGDVPRVSLLSPDLREERLAMLREIVPEAFADGKLDPARLTAALGEVTDTGPERYGLSWKGKAECIRLGQRPSSATLLPDREGSVDWDSTENLVIEGDNLEVLKLLQRGYAGKVKLIYIDPPYNTGKEFIYSDNFRDPLRQYLVDSGQIAPDSMRTTSDEETGGRLHSRWLSMMWPRLWLARNLLAEDGVVAVSIDDREHPALRLLLDELFGPENFLATFVWINEGNVDNQSRVKSTHEYVVAYARTEGRIGKPAVVDPAIDDNSKLLNDEIENTITKNGPANPESVVTLPVGFPATFDEGTLEPRTEPWPKIIDVLHVAQGCLSAPARLSSGWSSKRLLEQFIANAFMPITDMDGKETRFALTHTGAVYTYKRRPQAQGHVLSVIRAVGTTQQNNTFLQGLGIRFPYPKPALLLKYLVAVFANPAESLVLDFFAGSGTTGDAVMRLNAEDGGKRRFILVQYPEKTDQPGHPTIADITRARLRAAKKLLDEKEAGQLALPGADPTPPKHDRGFRSYKLAPSNFRLWDGEGAAREPGALTKQLAMFVDPLVEGRTPEEVVTEILLKSGAGERVVTPLSDRVEERTLAGRRVFATSFVDGKPLLFICLDRPLDREVFRAMMEAGAEQVVVLDAGFSGNDELKANISLELASHDVLLRTI